jgi:hypothetical protein
MHVILIRARHQIPSDAFAFFHRQKRQIPLDEAVHRKELKRFGKIRISYFGRRCLRAPH